MALSTYIVRRWMTPAPETIGPEASLQEARRLMDRGDFRHLPVVSGREVVGIISDRDLRSSLPPRSAGSGAAGPGDRLLAVGSIMCRNPAVVSPNTPVGEAARLLIDLQIGALPVIDEGEIVGIFSQVDGLQALISALMHLKDVARPERRASAGRPPPDPRSPAPSEPD